MLTFQSVAMDDRFGLTQNSTMVLRAGMLTSLGEHRQPANEKGMALRNEKRCPG
jgi:hypothetical protein